MADFEQPASFAFDPESAAEIDRIVAKYPAGRQASAVIPGLYVVQRQMKRQTGSAWVPVKRNICWCESKSLRENWF